MADPHSDSPERAVFILGLIGFSREQEELIGHVIGGCGDLHTEWRLGPLGQADLWWANGARAQLLNDGSIRIAPGVVGGRSVRLTLAEVDRPIAFSEPLVCRELEPACRFTLENPASMRQAIAMLQGQWLAWKGAQLWIAARLIRGERVLSSRIYHVVGGGRLLAVVDRTGDVGVLPGIGPADLESATWIARPSSASFIPPAFLQTTISEIVWLYAVRTSADLLPGRYRSGKIYFRRPPRISQRLLEDEHLLAMRHLVVGPATFAELQHRTGSDAPALARSLAALYLTGSITSSPRRAADRRPCPDDQSQSHSQSGRSTWLPTGSSSMDGLPAFSGFRDLTVPASLHHENRQPTSSTDLFGLSSERLRVAKSV